MEHLAKIGLRLHCNLDHKKESKRYNSRVIKIFLFFIYFFDIRKYRIFGHFFNISSGKGVSHKKKEYRR